MTTNKILFTIKLRDDWIVREKEMEKEIEVLQNSNSKDELATAQKSLERIKKQVANYSNLTRDMKKDVKPAKIDHLLNALFKT